MIKPGDLLKGIELCFGDPEEMTNERYKCLHFNTRELWYQPYIKRNERYFKLLKVLEK